jgi:hypothetical protein
MDINAIVQSLDAVISSLEKIRALLTGHTAPLKRGLPPEGDVTSRKRRKKSAEGRARIAAARKARWAKKKRK